MATRFVYNSRYSSSSFLSIESSEQSKMSERPSTSKQAEDEFQPIPTVGQRALLEQPLAARQPALLEQPLAGEQPLSKRKQRLLAKNRSTPMDPNEVQVVVLFVDADSHGGTEQAMEWLLGFLSEEDREAVRAKTLTLAGNAVFWFATVEAGYAALWSFASRANPNGEPVVPMWGWGMKEQAWQRILAYCNLPRTQPRPRKISAIERYTAWKEEIKEQSRRYRDQLIAAAETDSIGGSG